MPLKLSNYLKPATLLATAFCTMMGCSSSANQDNFDTGQGASSIPGQRGACGGQQCYFTFAANTTACENFTEADVILTLTRAATQAEKANGAYDISNDKTISFSASFEYKDGNFKVANYTLAGADVIGSAKITNGIVSIPLDALGPLVAEQSTQPVTALKITFDDTKYQIQTGGSSDAVASLDLSNCKAATPPAFVNLTLNTIPNLVPDKDVAAPNWQWTMSWPLNAVSCEAGKHLVLRFTATSGSELLIPVTFTARNGAQEWSSNAQGTLSNGNKTLTFGEYRPTFANDAKITDVSITLQTKAAATEQAPTVTGQYACELNEG